MTVDHDQTKVNYRTGQYSMLVYHEFGGTWLCFSGTGRIFTCDIEAVKFNPVLLLYRQRDTSDAQSPASVNSIARPASKRADAYVLSQRFPGERGKEMARLWYLPLNIPMHQVVVEAAVRVAASSNSSDIKASQHVLAKRRHGMRRLRDKQLEKRARTASGSGRDTAGSDSTGMSSISSLSTDSEADDFGGLIAVLSVASSALGGRMAAGHTFSWVFASADDEEAPAPPEIDMREPLTDVEHAWCRRRVQDCRPLMRVKDRSSPSFNLHGLGVKKRKVLADDEADPEMINPGNIALRAAWQRVLERANTHGYWSAYASFGISDINPLAGPIERGLLSAQVL